MWPIPSPSSNCSTISAASRASLRQLLPPAASSRLPQVEWIWTRAVYYHHFYCYCNNIKSSSATTVILLIYYCYNCCSYTNSLLTTTSKSMLPRVQVGPPVQQGTRTLLQHVAALHRQRPGVTGENARGEGLGHEVCVREMRVTTWTLQSGCPIWRS